MVLVIGDDSDVDRRRGAGGGGVGGGGAGILFEQLRRQCVLSN